MTPKEEVIQRILDAWRLVGAHPLYHEQAKRELRRMWPTLYKALVALDEASADD